MITIEILMVILNLERLCCMMHFQQYDDNIKEWIKENLPKGELIVDPSKSSFDYDIHK